MPQTAKLKKGLKERLEGEGYSDIDIKPTSKDDDGNPLTWRGKATRNGEPVTINVDQNDNATVV